jgi:sulfonate transport system permease protein
MKKSNKMWWANKGIDTALMIATPLIILILWQAYSDNGAIRQTVLPSPEKIFARAVRLTASGELFKHLSISLLRVLKGYFFGAVIGVTVGAAMGLVSRFEKALTLIFGIIRPIPIIAWVPILILWVGIGETSKVVIIAFGTFFPVLLNTIHGIQSTDRKFIEVASVLEKSKFTVLVRIILPSALPAIFTGLRIALGTAWMSVVGAEMIAASSGIGYFISFSGQLSQPQQMFVGVFAIGFIGLLFDTVLRLLERVLLRWNINYQE